MILDPGGRESLASGGGKLGESDGVVEVFARGQEVSRTIAERKKGCVVGVDLPDLLGAGVKKKGSARETRGSREERHKNAHPHISKLFRRVELRSKVGVGHRDSSFGS